MMKLRVSIIIPVHENSNYLKDTLDSVIAQTYDNIEIIVVGNELTSRGVADQIVKSYSCDRITFLTRPNSSVAEALNYGVEKSTGRYFSWLSNGDTYEPDRVRSTGQTSH
ncbi:glycosyltransferase [Candidatus Saccharibacteria bacterium]|nr:MAG: glycosyltransferase [Candidatus Saccharibacteria bacterium]